MGVPSHTTNHSTSSQSHSLSQSATQSDTQANTRSNVQPNARVDTRPSARSNTQPGAQSSTRSNTQPGTRDTQSNTQSDIRSRARSTHATGVADSGRWSTRRIAVYALFVALAMAVSFIEFPLIPGVAWLKYDPSGIVGLIAGFAYGPAAAVIVSVLGFVPHLFADPWGTLMAVAVGLAMSVPAALVYRRMRTRRNAVIGIIVGAIVALVVAIIGNLLITPIYASMTVSEVAALVVPALLPFNLVKLAIHSVVTLLIYKPISTVLNR